MIDTDFMGDEEQDPVLAILEGDDPDLTLVIKEYWNDIQGEISEAPIMKLYVATMYKMAKEYTRMEDQITEMMTDIRVLGDSPTMSNERSRLRDNINASTMEGWKLLNALLGSLERIQTMLNKLKGNDNDEDPFESFMKG